MEKRDYDIEQARANYIAFEKYVCNIDRVEIIRVPDVAFIEAAQLATKDMHNGVWPGPPALIAEVVTEPARVAEVRERIDDFLHAGTAIAWSINAIDETVTVIPRRGSLWVCRDHDRVLSSPVLPHFYTRVYEFFGG